jgi:uncharacterized protein YodC (DUF2158 family)
MAKPVMIKPGDVVRLKSSEHEMTVVHVTAADGNPKCPQCEEYAQYREYLRANR